MPADGRRYAPYYLPGWYTQHLRDTATGCYRNLVIHISVNDTLRDTLHHVMCAGAAFDTNGHLGCVPADGRRYAPYYLPGWYTQHLRDTATGCYRNLVIHLMVKDTFWDTIYPKICIGSRYANGPFRFDSSGVYTVRYASVWGCDSTVVISLQVVDTVRDTVYRTICAGGTFDTMGMSFSMPRVYSFYVPDTSVCAKHRLTVVLSVSDTLRDTVHRTICAGSVFDTNGYSYGYQGRYIQYLRDTVSGCYQNLVIYLTVSDTLRDTVRPFICAGSSFDTNGHSYYYSGTYLQQTRDAGSGCFHNLVVMLTVNDTLRDTVRRTLCKGQVLDTNGVRYSDRGFYSQFLRETSTGCYKRMYIDLSLNDTFRVVLNDTVCAGATYELNNRTYTLSGTYLQPFLTVHGCDSIVEINLTVNDTLRDTVRPVLCAGKTFDTNGVTYGLQGVYTQYFRDSANGCFSNLVIDLTVNDTIRAHVYDTICEGDVYRFDGQLLASSGNYRNTTLNAEGCDSITYLHLHVVPTPQLRLYDTVYNGGTYSYCDTTYTETGVYYHLFERGGALCDSVVILHLWFCDSVVTDLYDTVCNDSSYYFGGQLITQSGVYRTYLHNYMGCDSIVRLHITVVDYPVLKILDSTGFCKDGVATLRLTTNANVISWTSWPYDSTLSGQEHNTTIHVAPRRQTRYSVVADIVPREKTCRSTASKLIEKASRLRAVMKREEIDGQSLKNRFTDISVGEVVYREWLFHESAPQSLDRRVEYDSIVVFQPLPESEEFRVRLVVQNTEGCTDTTANTYPVIWADLWVPNAFTPDGDNNTLFKVGAYNVSEYEIFIYNRAGLLVFKANGVDQSWDGTYNGHPCLPGSYVYVINYRAKAYPTQQQKKVGSVLLIR